MKLHVVTRLGSSIIRLFERKTNSIARPPSLYWGKRSNFSEAKLHLFISCVQEAVERVWEEEVEVDAWTAIRIRLDVLLPQLCTAQPEYVWIQIKIDIFSADFAPIASFPAVGDPSKEVSGWISGNKDFPCRAWDAPFHVMDYLRRVQDECSSESPSWNRPCLSRFQVQSAPRHITALEKNVRNFNIERIQTLNGQTFRLTAKNHEVPKNRCITNCY